MKHGSIFAILGAIVAIAFAGFVTWANRASITTSILIFDGVAIGVALALAIPADFKNACASVAPYIPVLRGGAPPSGGNSP